MMIFNDKWYPINDQRYLQNLSSLVWREVLGTVPVLKWSQYWEGEADLPVTGLRRIAQQLVKLSNDGPKKPSPQALWWYPC